MAVKDDYQDFKNALNDLKINSKPLINFLTILAEEKIHNAPQIVRAIEERILKTKGDYVLPVLYVLDSIVKNLRSTTYIQLFENKLPVIFASAFNKVDERTRLAMFKLRQTWPQYFSGGTLHNLDTRTHYIDPAWPITARVPDPSPSTPTIHINPDFIQRNKPTAPLPAHQPRPPAKQEDNDRAVKNSDTSSRDDAYHMIPIDRKEPNRQEIEQMIIKDNDDEQQQQQSNRKKENEGKFTANNNNHEASPEEVSNNKLSAEKTAPVMNHTAQNNDDVLFGGADIDYRDTDVNTQPKVTTTSLDTDRLFELNSKCLSLAEQKFKSKELSSEEYQATLKLLQNILQNEVQRLTVPSTTTPSLINNSTHSVVTSLANTMPSITSAASNNPFQPSTLQFSQQPTPLQFPQQHPSTATTLSLSAFPFAGYGNDTQRHAMQILAAVGALSSYAPNNPLLPYIPPLPPAPPPFNLVPNNFPSQVPSSTAGRLSPSIKRPHDENSNNHSHSDEKSKRPCYDASTNHTIRSHNFDDESIALVPSLIDANINTLKKKYSGVIQQLYFGKYQCRLCGLRFTAKQKHLYTHHLDWHYWENRQASTPAALLDRCRDWYPSLQEWTVYEENIDEQIRNSQLKLTQNRQPKDTNNRASVSSLEFVSCPAQASGDTNDDRCYVCHDPFENFFDDNREEWCLKDAMRVDAKTYHPICYQDVQYQETHENRLVSSINDRFPLNEHITDETSNNSTDSQVFDNAMATVAIKSENDNKIIKDLLSSLSSEDEEEEDSTKPKYLSSMSFVSLVDTIFVKKEDLKPIENIEPVTINVKEEPLDTTTMSEEIPFLSIT
ncbi:unnamed protein product [Rotaria socialis]|uniref:CID domain-containing protein n=1 Tax=Rotaria socialis TaxID=392032 RepID=A0A820YH01_9BILA|nr:unnamed protein product [Rotaria socialis]CAF4545882.1 unnamed protein product [Rotaria socialis]